MIKIFKLIKNVNKQNIYRFTAKKKKKKNKDINSSKFPLREETLSEKRQPLVIHREDTKQASHLVKGQQKTELKIKVTKF